VVRNAIEMGYGVNDMFQFSEYEVTVLTRTPILEVCLQST